MAIEVLIVISFWILLGLIIGLLTGLPWWAVSLIVVAIILLYDSSVIQAENRDMSQQRNNN